MISFLFLVALVKFVTMTIMIIMISNSNWTEWSTIQGVIARVIAEARDRFKNTSAITP